MKLETTIDDLTLSKDELKAENEDMKEGKDRLTEMNKDLIAINQTLKSRNEDMATANKKLTNEREELFSRNDKVVDNVTALKMKSDALKDVNDKLSAKLAETLEELSKSKVDCLKSALVLEEENKQLSEMVAEAQNALKDLGRENQALQIEIAKQNGRKWKNDTEVMPCLIAIFILNWCFQTKPLLHFSYISISDMVLQSCILPISPVLPIAEIS
jgi:predicted nuclease with TOPRIM domain